MKRTLGWVRALDVRLSSDGLTMPWGGYREFSNQYLHFTHHSSPETDLPKISYNDTESLDLEGHVKGKERWLMTPSGKGEMNWKGMTNNSKKIGPPFEIDKRKPLKQKTSSGTSHSTGHLGPRAKSESNDTKMGPDEDMIVPLKCLKNRRKKEISGERGGNILPFWASW